METVATPNIVSSFVHGVSTEGVPSAHHGGGEMITLPPLLPPSSSSSVLSPSIGNRPSSVTTNNSSSTSTGIATGNTNSSTPTPSAPSSTTATTTTTVNEPLSYRFEVKLTKGTTNIINFRELLKEDLGINNIHTAKTNNNNGQTVSVPSSSSNEISKQPGTGTITPDHSQLQTSGQSLNTSQGDMTDSQDASFDDSMIGARNRVTYVIEKIERMYAGEKDIFEGYDTEDSFIDDSDVADLEVNQESNTSYGGFFIHKGEIEQNASSNDSGNNKKKRKLDDDGKPKKKQKENKKPKSSDKESKKQKDKDKDNKEKEKKPKKKKDEKTDKKDKTDKKEKKDKKEKTDKKAKKSESDSKSSSPTKRKPDDQNDGQVSKEVEEALKEFEQVAQKAEKSKRFPKELDPLLNKVCSLAQQSSGYIPVEVFDKLSKITNFTAGTLRTRFNKTKTIDTRIQKLQTKLQVLVNTLYAKASTVPFAWDSASELLVYELLDAKMTLLKTQNEKRLLENPDSKELPMTEEKEKFLSKQKKKLQTKKLQEKQEKQDTKDKDKQDKADKQEKQPTTEKPEAKKERTLSIHDRRKNKDKVTTETPSTQSPTPMATGSANQAQNIAPVHMQLPPRYPPHPLATMMPPSSLPLWAIYNTPYPPKQ